LSHQIEGILLAAGESRRMGFPKPLLRIGTTTFLAHTAAAMLSVASRLIIVVGAHAYRVGAAVPHKDNVKTVINPNWDRGQLSSLKAGLGAASADCRAVLVHLGDHPLVKPETFHDLVAEYERTRQPIVIARYSGRRGHPVLFDRSIFTELMSVPEDQGARVVVNADPARVVYFEVDDPGVILDLDTPADLARAGLAPPPGNG
jgi:molybdenum cofactor cytidylyltransferase